MSDETDTTLPPQDSGSKKSAWLWFAGAPITNTIFVSRGVKLRGLKHLALQTT